MGRKYAWICICSSKLAGFLKYTLGKLFPSLGTDSVPGKTSLHIFVPNGGYSLCTHHSLFKVRYRAAQIYPNYAYAYYTLVFCVYAYVYTRIRVCEYARICPFVMHSYKFLYMKHCWSNKGHMGMKRLQSKICILLKRHADE